MEVITIDRLQSLCYDIETIKFIEDGLYNIRREEILLNVGLDLFSKTILEVVEEKNNHYLEHSRNKQKSELKCTDCLKYKIAIYWFATNVGIMIFLFKEKVTVSTVMDRNEWKTVKKTAIKKRENYIHNFWEIGDKYMDPSTFIEWKADAKNRPEAPFQLSIQESIPGNRYFPRLADLKKKLMEEKSKLDVYNVINWSKHTNFTYLYSELTKILRKEYDVELCTTAWTKMWEILTRFLPDAYIKNQKSLRALYLCEGPGSFIACTNHYLKSRYGGAFNFEWSAITLADQENNLFDRYFPRWVPNNWFFGPDGTGDITNPDTIINGVWSRHMNSKCDLVTADGSVNCQHDPNNQELIVCPLKYAEIVSMLKCLKINGIFIIKYFTLFEAQTVCQVWLLANLFKKISVIKPVTSRPGNSEIYIVCTGYNGISDEMADTLVKSSPTSLIFVPESIPTDFLNFVTHTMTSIVDRQSRVIEKNIDWFNNKYKMNAQKMYTTKDFVAREFIKKYGIKKLNDDMGLYV